MSEIKLELNNYELNQNICVENKKESCSLISETENQLNKYEPKRKIGNLYCFYYVNGIPKIVIGPDCNYFFIFRFILRWTN